MSDDIRLAFIGAGQVNFGGGEGPWNHAARFEQIDGVACAAVADVDLGRAERAILQQQKGPSPQPWARSQAFESWQKMADEVRPDAVVIGMPPVHHGRSQGAGAVEVELAQRSISMLIEKPISTADPAEVARVAACTNLVRPAPLVCRNSLFQVPKCRPKINPTTERQRKLRPSI